MRWFKATLLIDTRGKGLYAFTDRVAGLLADWRVGHGLCHLFCQHTSASLVISENYDPTAKADLASFMERLVPEGQAWYTHDLEGPDDATSHIRSMLTDVNLTVPVDDGQLSLGNWQGLYLFEHRAVPHRRQVLLRVMEVDDRSVQVD